MFGTISPPLRAVDHPGIAIEPRILSTIAPPGRDFRLFLPQDTDLLSGLANSLRHHGIATAGVRLAGGGFKSFSYYTGVEDPTGARVATFSPPHQPALPVTLVIANAIIGLDEDDDPKSHCHAIFIDADGQCHGGHLISGKCIVGASGLIAWVTDSGQAQLKVRHDPETNFPIFHPQSGKGARTDEK